MVKAACKEGKPEWHFYSLDLDVVLSTIQEAAGPVVKTSEYMRHDIS